jgi:hypothetical protein
MRFKFSDLGQSRIKSSNVTTFRVQIRKNTNGKKYKTLHTIMEDHAHAVILYRELVPRPDENIRLLKNEETLHRDLAYFRNGNHEW